jgi:tetratricopeptide (TPR) repeat protein
MSNAGELIESKIEQEDWLGARRLIRSELSGKPNDHWLLTRLSLTYYERREYDHALKFSGEALKVAPHCPLAIWDHAGTFEMLDRTERAVTLYRRLIRRGVHRIAVGRCGEGVSWARGLVADCWYRLAHCYGVLGKRGNAVQAYRRHLALRGPGCRSIYARFAQDGAPRAGRNACRPNTEDRRA